jgi:hypothetical protein
MAKQLPTKAVLLGTLNLGNQINGNQWTPFALDGLPEFLTPGNKAIVTKFETKITGVFTTSASDAALYSYFLHNCLDTEFYAAGVRIVSRQGWQDPIWDVLSSGRIGSDRCADLPATGGGGPGSYTRTFSKSIKFVDDRLSSRLARCWPAISLAKGGAYLRFYLHAAAEVLKTVHLGLTSGTQLEVWAHLLDVPAAMVPVPAYVEEMSEDGKKETNPTPGLGQYMTIAMVNPPQNQGQGTSLDDLSAYTTIDSFGTKGRPIVDGEKVDFVLRKFNEAMVDDVDARPANGPQATNKLETRSCDPRESADGLTRMIPLQYMRRGQDISEAPKFYGDFPRLRANNNVTTGLPTQVSFLVRRVQPRDPKMVGEIVKWLSNDAINRPLVVPPGYTDGKGNMRANVDAQRIPLFADAR